MHDVDFGTLLRRRSRPSELDVEKERGKAASEDDELLNDSDVTAKVRLDDAKDSPAAGDASCSAATRARAPFIVMHDLTDDTVSLRTYLESFLHRDVYMAIFYALRITFLVGLPLGFLARYSKVSSVFPMRVVIPLWGLSTCLYTVGEQVAAFVVLSQVAVGMLIWGTLMNAWNITAHSSAWWCACIFAPFVVSMFGDIRCKRLLTLHIVLIMQMLYLPGGSALIFPSKACRDMIMAGGFSLVQVLFPPRFVANDCDQLLAEGWMFIGATIRNAATVCWSTDPIESAIGLGKTTTEPLHALFMALPQKLFFIQYEVFESTLRLKLREERFEVMRQMLPLLHALNDTVRAIAMEGALVVHNATYCNRARKLPTDSPALGVFDSDPLNGAALDPAQTTASGVNSRQSGSPVRLYTNDQRAPYGQPGVDKEKGEGEGAEASELSPLHSPRLYQEVRRSISHLFQLPPAEEKRSGGRARHPNASFASLRNHPSNNASMVGYSVDAREKIHQIVQAPLARFLDALDDVLRGLCKHLNPHDTVRHVPFDALRAATAELQSSMSKVHYELLIRSNREVDPFLYINTVFLHLSFVFAAERLLQYGELMSNFDRRRYPSTLDRIIGFFFMDYWRSFWQELPKRLTLATPRDVRILKDAVKMACAYGMGVMFTMYIDPENIYRFGMAILMGVGWPTAGDTMIASVYRIMGMVSACSIAYIAIWHTNNLAGELSLSLAGIFVASLFRDRAPYNQAAHYSAMLTLTTLNSASSKLQLLCRVISNTCTVLTYYAICICFFPIDTIKVTFGYEVRSIMAVAERFGALVEIISEPLCGVENAAADVVTTQLNRVTALHKPMWQSVLTFGSWLPKAEAEPVAHGKPYPIADQKNFYQSLRRLASATDVINMALQVLCRPRENRPDFTVEQVLHDVTPVMREINAHFRVVVQDFIDAMDTPRAWSFVNATRNFSNFLALSSELHDAITNAHRRNVVALRTEFSHGVLNRTFAAAASSHLFQPASQHPSPHSPRVRPASPPPQQQWQQGVIPPEPHPFNASMPSVPPATRSGTPTFTNGSIARGLAEKLAQRSLRGHPLAMGSTPTASTTTTTTSSTARSDVDDVVGPPQAAITNRHLEADSNTDVDQHEDSSRGGADQRHEQPHSRCAMQSPLPPSSHEARSRAEIEDFLRPMEQQAEEDEYLAFIAQRDPQYRLQPNQFSVSHEVNMVILMVVGADMFFAESEKLLKVMYYLNIYSRSRLGPK